MACYGTEWELNDCSYHEFDSTTSSSIDISIKCVSNTDSEGYDDKDKDDSTVDSKTGDSPTGASSTFYASLSISALLSLVVVTLAAVIIVLFALRRRKMRSKR